MQPVRFLAELDVRIHPCPPPGADPSRCYQLHSALTVQVGENWLLHIPEGFWSDGGSIPSLLWSLLCIHPLSPRFARSFFLHDFLYAVGFRNRLLCDDLLLSGTVTDRAPECRRELVYRGVRLGGWATWNRYRARSGLELQKSIHSLRKDEPMFCLTVANWARNLDGLS